MRLPWLGGLFGLCCSFCHSFLTSCGVDDLLRFRSLYLAFTLVLVLLGHGPFLLQSSPCLLCVGWHFYHSASLPLPCCILVCARWASFGPVMHFPFYSVHVAQYYCWACSHTILGFLGLFYSFGHPRPILILHSHGLLLNILGFPGPITISLLSHLLILFFGLLCPIFHNSHGFTTSFFELPWACLLSLGPFDYPIGL